MSGPSIVEAWLAEPVSYGPLIMSRGDVYAMLREDGESDFVAGSFAFGPPTRTARIPDDCWPIPEARVRLRELAVLHGAAEK